MSFFKKIICIASLFMTMTSLASSLSVPIKLEKAHIKINDEQSIIRGAKFYATYCMSCHSMKYLRFDPIAKQAGLLYQNMPSQNKLWTTVPPPDLTLIARIHKPNWLYTYLHSFYRDDQSPLGSNNLLVDNVNMPNPFLALQGEQWLIVDKKELFSHADNLFVQKPRYFRVLKLVRQGSMSSDEFDQALNDLVAFLVYASDPSRAFRLKLGWGVLAFIFILFIIVYFLYKEYWRDLK